MIRTERKYVEILRILKEHRDPVGAKRLSELMAERGFVLSDRAVQYYLSYLDSMGFTEKIGNQGRILTPPVFLKPTTPLSMTGSVLSSPNLNGSRTGAPLTRQQGPGMWHTIFPSSPRKHWTGLSAHSTKSYMPGAGSSTPTGFSITTQECLRIVSG